MAGYEEVPRHSSRVKARCQRDGGRAAVRAQGVSAARQYYVRAKRPKFSHKMPRANWTEPRIRSLLQLVIREKNLLNWNESRKSLTRLGWSTVCPDFRRQTRLNYDVRKLQNKLHGIKTHYFSWLKLQKQSGLGRDKNTGGVTADASFWEERG